jgi:hypothetical protein
LKRERRFQFDPFRTQRAADLLRRRVMGRPRLRQPFLVKGAA